MAAGTPCPNCSRINRPGVKFCANCGKPLAVPPPQSSAPAPQAPPPQAPPPQQQTPRVQPPSPSSPPPRAPASPQPPPRPSAVTPPASRQGFKLQPVHFAVIGAAAVAGLLCAVLLFLLAQNSGMFGARANETATAAALVSMTATAAPTEAASPTASVVIPTATPLAPTVPPTLDAVAMETRIAGNIFATQTASAPTAIPPTAAPLPTNTELPPPPTNPPPPPTATRQPRPTQTATTPPPTDTPPGSILPAGQTWTQNGMAMTVGIPKFAVPCQAAMLEFPVTIQNNTSGDIVTSLTGSAFLLTDNRGQAHEMWYANGANPLGCEQYKPVVEYTLNALAPNQKVDLTFQVRGAPPPEVSNFVFFVVKAGRIEGAQWNLPVPR